MSHPPFYPQSISILRAILEALTQKVDIMRKLLFSFPDRFILELKAKKKENFFPPLSFWDIQIKMTPLSKLMLLLELHKGRQMMEGRGGWRGGVPELIRDCLKWILYNWVIFIPSIVFHSDGAASDW